jgi:hypothetical protein
VASSAGASAEPDLQQLIAISEPVVRDSLNLKPDAAFGDVYVVTAPSHKPHRYAADLPRAAASVCGHVEVAGAPLGQAKLRRFFATFAGKPGQPDESQVDVAVEDNNPADLSLDAMERSARFMRGWRQYCQDAGHPD